LIKLADLVNAMAQTLANIPEVVQELSTVDPVLPYIDMNPLANSVEKALYQMQPGQVLVLWIETVLVVEAMTKWVHRVEICVRSMRDHSDLDLISLIMNGVPIPGDGMIWRMCPVMPGVLPTEVMGIARRTDTEGVDYAVIQTETAETGDWPLP
jgi:TusA-related sulfurtransferase